MEVCCLSSSKDTYLLKALLRYTNTTTVQIVEYGQNDLKVNDDKMEFPIWPYLKQDGKICYYGLQSIVKVLFASKFDLSSFDSCFSIGESIYSTSCPIIAQSNGVLIDKHFIDEYPRKLSNLLSIVQPFLAIESISSIYLTAILRVIVSCGIDVSPCKADPCEDAVLCDQLREEAIQFAHSRLGVQIRYALSPPPEKPLYLTTPIYYVNGDPHIGHIFTTTIVDTLSSWYKIRGFDCIYSSGVDEHGLKVQTTAQANNKSPQEWCDKLSGVFVDAFDEFDLRPDVFIRTTDPKHKKVARKLWSILKEKGYIYQGLYEGWYSKRDECFIPDNQVKEIEVDGKTIHINAEDTIDSSTPLEWSSELNWKFKLSALSDKLLQWLDSNPTCITPHCYHSQARSLVCEGLNDISISRQKSKVSWAIPVPDDDTQTIYVWIEALANYLTVSGWDGEGQIGRWPADLHTVGKDILKFHGIYWPALLIAADIPCYKRLLVHGWWTKDHKKISKSLGNALDPHELTEYWGLEATKYFLLKEATLSTDADYSDLAMLKSHNSDLADTFFNLVLRILSQGINPSMEVPSPNEYSPEDQQIIEEITLLPGTVDHCILFGETRIALQQMWTFLKNLNQYTTKEKPWVLKKSDTRRADTVNYVLLESLRIFCVCLTPFMRQTSTKILECLGSAGCFDFNFGVLKQGTKISTPPVLFPKKTLPKQE